MNDDVDLHCTDCSSSSPERERSSSHGAIVLKRMMAHAGPSSFSLLNSILTCMLSARTPDTASPLSPASRPRESSSTVPPPLLGSSSAAPQVCSRQVSVRRMLRAAAIIATAVTFLTIPAAGYVLRATAKDSLVLRAHDGGVTESRGDLVGRGDAVRQTFLGAALFGAALYAPSRANAGWFGASAGDDVSTALDDVAKTRVKVEEILNGLKKKELKGGRDDSATVVRYSDAFYKPLQAKLVDLAPKLQLGDGEQQKRAELLPLLLKGHLFELSAATRSGNAAEQLEEMEEVAETVDEFLTLAKTKYGVKDYVSQKAEQWDVVKEYGPFACEFWGKQRLPDSNICVPKEG